MASSRSSALPPPEHPLPDAAGQHAWEQPGYERDSDSPESEADPMTDPTVAAHEFVSVLMELYLTSVISAKTLCVLCFWCSRAGLRGEVEQLAHKPGVSTGSYQTPGSSARL